MGAAGAAETLLARYRPAVEAEMRRMLEGRELPLYGMLRYHLGWTDATGTPLPGFKTGKGIRPSLCLLACEAAGGDPGRALPAAAALELLHNFTLVHDDVEDDGPQRWNRPTVWSLWGKPQAVNAGDALHVVSTLAMHSLEDRGVPPDVVLRAARTLHDTCLRLCEGQYLDMSFEGRTDVTEAEYLQMIGGKSAALISTSLELGALLGGAAPPAVAAIREAGFRLGLAFQIQDDVLGIWGDEGRVGKTANDVAQRKKSLPVIFGFQHASNGDRATLERIYSAENVTPGDVAAVIEVLERSGARQRSKELAQRFAIEGMAHLKSSGLSDGQLRELVTVAEFLIQRDY